MLPAILAQIGLPALLTAVQEGLKTITSSDLAQGAADAVAKVKDAITGNTISLDQVKEANRHIETLATLESDETQNTMSEVNQSLRAEVVSEDPYVRRMRPTFGYIMAITWAAQMLALAVTILNDPKGAAEIISSMSALSTIWSVGLAVLGIYVYKRSEEKKARI